MSGQIIVGPVLGFRGVKAGRWHTSALVVLLDSPMPPQLNFTVEGVPQPSAAAVLLKVHAKYYVWRLDWSVAQTESEQPVNYTLNIGQTYRYLVPAQNNTLRLCYGSCFGVHTLQDVNKLKNKNAMWKVLEREHQAKPYHLFFLGGDQIYSDQVWETVPALRDWLSKKLKKRILTPFTPELEQQVRQYYFNLYLQMWRQKHAANMLSQIPTLMMWDDHDIFDGWGSYVPAQQECAVFKGIYGQAREHFRLFQLQAKSDDDLGEATILGKQGFTYAYRIGDLALVALDLRSERTQNQVMSPATHHRLQAWLDEELKEKILPDNAKRPGCKHLLLLSGIPIVNADLTLLETALDIRPGQQRTEDDLKDQWLSHAHQEERRKLIKNLFRFSQEAGCRVTIVSGDAHVAFCGYLQLEQNPATNTSALNINQLTSSAMVNLPPPTLVVYMMEKLLAGKVEEVDQGITARLIKFPETNRRILGVRNWLALTLDEQSCIGAKWYVEGEAQPFTKVIYPLGGPSA